MPNGDLYRIKNVDEGWIWDDMKKIRGEIKENDMFIEISVNPKWPTSRTFQHLNSGKTISGVGISMRAL